MDPVYAALLEVRVQLLIKNPFFGTLLLRLDLVDASKWCKTMTTDGKHLFYNRDYVQSFDKKQLTFVFAHILLHCALDHLSRSEDKDKEIWDIATDYVVNSILVTEGIGTPPPDTLYSPKYNDLSADEVYRILLEEEKNGDLNRKKLLEKQKDEHLNFKNDKKKNKEKSEKIDVSENIEESSDEDDVESEDGNPSEGESEKSEEGDAGEDEGDSEDGDSNGESEDGDNPGESGEDGDDGDGDSGEGEGEGEGDSDSDSEGGEGEGNGEGKGEGSGETDQEGGSSTDSSSENGPGSSESTNDSPSGKTDQDVTNSNMDGSPESSNGEAPDNGTEATVDYTERAPEYSESEIEEMRHAMKAALINALQSNTGNSPAALQRLIEDYTTPTIDWKELLANTMASVFNKEDYSFNIPSKRSYCMGKMEYILPSQKNGQTIDICVSLDTSGSISDEIFASFLSEVRGIVEQYDDYKLHIWCIDAAIYNPQTFTPDNVSELDDYKIAGGGGNDFPLNWRYMEENEIVPELFVVFSDGQPCGSWGDPDYCDTIFVIRNEWDKDIEAPFGLTVYMDDDLDLI